MKGLKFNYIIGEITYIDGMPYFETEEGIFDIGDDDILTIYRVPRGEARPVRWVKKKHEIVEYEKTFSRVTCHLYPRGNRSVILYDNDIPGLFDYVPGDEITVVPAEKELSLIPEVNHHVYGTLKSISDDLKSFEIEATEVEDNKVIIKSFEFGQVHYVLNGHRLLRFY